MRLCCCGRSETAPSTDDANTKEPLLPGGGNDAVDVRGGAPRSKDMDDRKTDMSVQSSMHSGKSSVLDPLDDSNLHEALHWDKIVQRTDESTEPTLLSVMSATS